MNEHTVVHKIIISLSAMNKLDNFKHSPQLFNKRWKKQKYTVYTLYCKNTYFCLSFFLTINVINNLFNLRPIQSKPLNQVTVIMSSTWLCHVIISVIILNLYYNHIYLKSRTHIIYKSNIVYSAHYVLYLNIFSKWCAWIRAVPSPVCRWVHSHQHTRQMEVMTCWA